MDKNELYNTLYLQTNALLEVETDPVANMANLAALVYHTLPDLNWAGFYLLKSGVLVLGPFQGRPACVRIALGRGVCGTAAQTRQTQLVQNVHEFPGHIACDAASNSEIVIPLVKNGVLIGVLDIDSPLLNCFDQTDKQGLEKLAALFLEKTDI